MAGEHADVLIVGAGAGGGVAARRLVDAGLSVVALEQGHWQDANNYRGGEWDWELAAGKAFSASPAQRNAPWDYPIDTRYSDMEQINFNGVGGGTVLYNAVWLRFLESNFRTRSISGKGEDWPLGYNDLLRFYEQTDRDVGVSGLGGNPAYPPGTDPPLPALPLGEGGLAVARALARRGWHWWPETNAILSTGYDGRRACVQRGTCPTGCNEGAKSSIDLTHWRPSIHKGVRLITGARVTRIITDTDGLALGAEWHDAEGHAHLQTADVTLLAANAIGTARLLLTSAKSSAPEGLANRSGLVGKNLMLHPMAVVMGSFPDRITQVQNGSMLQSLEFAEHDSSRGFDLGAKWSLHPTSLGPAAEAMRAIAEGNASMVHRRVAARLGHGVMWSIICEDLPEEHNRVVLSPDMTDSHGLPAPRIVYRTNANARRILDYNVERAADVLRDAGSHDILIRNPTGRNAHFMGTARMGLDPDRSVVDRWQMAHEIPNLGVIDGSVFVTAAAVNPTSTIAALALRATEHLIENRRSLPVPSRASRVGWTPMLLVPAARQDVRCPRFDATSRARFAQAADALMPGDDIMPWPSAISIQDKQLDHVLASRPDQGAPLARALSMEFRDASERIAALKVEDAAAHLALLTCVTNAYYLDPLVRTAIRYEGQIARPFTPDRFPDYLSESLLDHMLSIEAI